MTESIPESVRALSDNQLVALTADVERALDRAESDYLSARTRRVQYRDQLKTLRTERYYRS